MRIQITFKDSKTQDIELAANEITPLPVFGPGDQAYLHTSNNAGDTFVYNWDVIKHVRSFYSETADSKQEKLPGVNA